MTKERLKMGVDVYFFILWILIIVKASRVHYISVLKFKCHDIVSGLIKMLVWDLNALSIKSDCTILNSIYFHVADHLPLKVNEKGDLRLRFSDLFQVKRDLVNAHIATFKRIR